MHKCGADHPFTAVFQDGPEVIGTATAWNRVTRCVGTLEYLQALAEGTGGDLVVLLQSRATLEALRDIKNDRAFAWAMMGSLGERMTTEDVSRVRAYLDAQLEPMKEWYETASFPISIRTNSAAVLQSVLLSEQRAAVYGGGWQATYSGAVDPSQAPKCDAGVAAYQASFPAPFSIHALSIAEQALALSQAVHATVSSGSGEEWHVRLADAVIPKVLQVW